MESNDRPTYLSPEDARASLDTVDSVSADLAERLVSPWWYYPGLGLIEALIVSSMTFPWWLQLPALVVAMALLGLLIVTWERLTGLGMSRQYNALAPRWIITLIGTLLAAMAVVLVVDSPVVTAMTAVVVIVACVTLGRGAESAMRDRLRHGARIG